MTAANGCEAWLRDSPVGDVLSPCRVLRLDLPLRQPVGAADHLADQGWADPFIDAQGKEALNFQITVSIAVMICMLLIVVVIGFPLRVLVGVGALVLTIIGALKANDGFAYCYPFTWRLIK